MFQVRYLIICSFLLLSGCGQKGPLFLPKSCTATTASTTQPCNTTHGS